MNKLYDRIDFVNNTTPALNETNLDLMSKAIDDIDDRVIEIAGDVLVVVPEILDKYADIEALATNPPYVGQNGHWWTWDTDLNQYVDSGVDAGVSVTVGTTTTLPAGSSATVTNSGTDTDPILNFGIPQGASGQNGQDGQDGVSPEVTITTITDGHTVTITDADHPTGQSFNVMDGQDGAPGVGVPSGGTTGQVLKKVSGTDYDTEWANESGGGSGGHTIINTAGASMTQRAGLQFEGMGVTDDSTNDKTVVTLPTPDYVDEQFNPSTTYSKGMTCIEGNVRYRYKNSTATSGHRPPDTTYWEVLSVSDELEWKYLGVVKTTTQSVSDLNNLEISVPTSAKEIQIKCFVNAYTNTFGAGCDPQDASNTSFPFVVKFVTQICKDAFSKDSQYDSVPIPVYGSAPPRVITGYIGYENNKVFLQSLYYNAPISMVQYRELWVKGGTNNLNRLYDNPIAECCYIKAWYR